MTKLSSLSVSAMVFVCSGQAMLSSGLNRRADEALASDFSLYAYGKGIKGLSMFYGDGLAYVGTHPPSFATQAFNITLSSAVNGTFTAKRNDSSPQLTMYLDTSASLEPIGFEQSANNLTSTESSSFGLYGGWVFHLNASDELEMKFYATPTNETDVHLVNWNGATATPTASGVSIALRTVAPVSLSS